MTLSTLYIYIYIYIYIYTHTHTHTPDYTLAAYLSNRFTTNYNRHLGNEESNLSSIIIFRSSTFTLASVCTSQRNQSVSVIKTENGEMSSQMYAGLHSRRHLGLLLSDFNQHRKTSTACIKTARYEISRKSVQLESCRSMRTDRRKDGHGEANRRIS